VGLQLPLPAGWAMHLASYADPMEHLDALKRDTDDAKVEIRAVLASAGAVNQTMRGYVDDLLRRTTI